MIVSLAMFHVAFLEQFFHASRLLRVVFAFLAVHQLIDCTVVVGVGYLLVWYRTSYKRCNYWYFWFHSLDSSSSSLFNYLFLIFAIFTFCRFKFHGFKILIEILSLFSGYSDLRLLKIALFCLSKRLLYPHS